jgi:hypothetical protein
MIGTTLIILKKYVSLIIPVLLDIVVPELYLAYLQDVRELVYSRLQAIVTILPKVDLVASIQLKCSYGPDSSPNFTTSYKTKKLSGIDNVSPENWNRVACIKYNISDRTSQHRHCSN